MTIAKVYKFSAVDPLFLEMTQGADGEETVLAAEAKQHKCEIAMIRGLVAGARDARGNRGKPTYPNIAKPYPESPSTALVWGKDRKQFKVPPESLKGRQARVFGKVRLLKGKAEMNSIRPEHLPWRRAPVPAEQASDLSGSE